MKLFIVYYWVGFPSSEYGGLINLVAENSDQAIEILKAKYIGKYNQDEVGDLVASVGEARIFDLADNGYEEGVIEEFMT